MNPVATWNLADDLRQMMAYPFMVNAVRAGTIVAVVAGAVGWVMVLRRESFAGHTLAVVGFPGAAAAVWLGFSTGLGYFAACVGAALLIAALPTAARSRGVGEQPAVIGTVQAFALATGMLFVSLYKGFLSGLTNLLFGTIAGVTDDQVTLLLAAGIPCLLLLLLLGRPLLWASLDPETAAAHGVPVRLVGAAFLLLLGVAAAGTSQVTGSLLVFALLVAPAAAAHQLTAHPAIGIAVSIVIALMSPGPVWVSRSSPRIRSDSGSAHSPSPAICYVRGTEPRCSVGEDATLRYRIRTARSNGPSHERAPRANHVSVRSAHAGTERQRGAGMSDLSAMLSHPFIIHALTAGTAVAILCGLVGYFVVQRGAVFAGDALGHVAYTGAMAALAAGIDPRIGLFAATVIAGLLLGAGGGRGGDDVAIGSFFAWTLGLGVLFLTYYTTHRSTGNGTANVTVLFGSIFGISASATTTAVLIAIGVGLVLLAISRPLLFATVDPAVAGAAGVPVRILGALFLAIVGVTVAEATQIVGAIVVLGLLAAPPAAAARLTGEPWRAFWLSAALATLAVGAGITVSYAIPAAPASFTIIAVAALGYPAAILLDRIRRYRSRAYVATGPSLS